MTPVYSIFPKIGLGGGGKIKAVYHRMNALAEMEGFDPVLINLDHHPKQKANFAELQASGVIAPGVRLLSVPDACYPAAVAAGVQPYDAFPAYDKKRTKNRKTTYLQGGKPVMTDRTTPGPLGPLTRRTVKQGAQERVYTLLDGLPTQMVQRNKDGTTETTDYARGLPIRWTKTKGGKFVIGRNLVTDTICRMERIYHQNLFAMINWDDAVVFFDGVTSAYLSPITHARRALFLHADHRAPGGEIVPRSRYLIENFKGEAIVTSTTVHKAQLEVDVTPAAPIHVVPHFTETPAQGDTTRQHLVTVSRLELTGKPIPECIEAFCQIMHDFPDVDYLIYGLGSGQPKLEKQIAALGCGDRVRLAGYTTDPLAVFQGALASVYPTLTEGFGLSILEALSCGCPVVSYDVNYGPREMIVPGVNGELVRPGDINAITRALRRVLSHPQAYQQGTVRGLERYTRQAYLDNYRDLVTYISKLPITAA